MPQALFWLGNMHLSGLGVEMNATRAYHYLYLAAEANHPQAQLMLSSLYACGYGAPRNTTAAVFWIDMARKTMSQSVDFLSFNVTQLTGFDT
jgi:TPR repeat protein